MKTKIIKIGIGAALFATGFVVSTDITWIQPAIFAIAYVIVGGGVVLEAVQNVFRGSIFDENFLMSIASLGAFAVGQYPEAVAVMLFFRIGEMFEDYAVNKSRRSIAELMDIRPDYANIKRGNDFEKVDPGNVRVGDTILVRAGEKIPLDGVVLEGTSTLDTSALTGESLPRSVTVGQEALSGCININGVLVVKVTKEFGESTVSKILELVENASSKKSTHESFITKFSAVYTPFVVVSALLLAVIPPLLIPGEEWSDWVYRALVFLVVSCPCALVISVPLSFFGGIGGASKAGILIKGSNYMEALARTETVAFDKTGTLTQGVFEVREVCPCGVTEDELLEMAAYAESQSTHPISISLKRAYECEIDSSRVSEVEEIVGHGISALFEGRKILAGNAKLMEQMGIAYNKNHDMGTVVYIAADGICVGSILISDKLKSDSAKAISSVKALGIKKIAMLTGDNKTVGEKIANELGIETVYAELLPGDKIEKVEELIAQNSTKGTMIFVGDGINDAPVLARADIGIAMGGLGSDAAIEAADVVIMTDEPSKIASAIKISRKTLHIANQNIVFALAVKFGVLLLAAAGIATMWAAVFADVGVTVIAIVNALRALKPIQ